MNMKQNNTIKKRILDNNTGSALIVCIIILLFVSILATVILYMSGINYRMKKSDYNTRVAFYSSEMPLENMKANLVIPYSEALNNGFRLMNTYYSCDSIPNPERLYGYNNAAPDIDNSAGASGPRREVFYNYVYYELEKFLLDNYSGPSVGSSTSSETDSKPFRYIIQNLTWNGIGANDGVHTEADMTNSANRIYANETGVDYSGNPKQYVDELINLQNPAGSGNFVYFVSDDTYIVLPSDLNQGNSHDNFKKFAELSIYNTPGDPSSGLLPEDECRILFKNVCVITVQNGYRSVVMTDVALQFPPLDWDGGGVDGYKAWNVYQLIYYVNWQKY